MTEVPISIKAAAKIVEVSHVAVYRAIREGRLVESVAYDEKGQPKILASKIVQEWIANTDHNRMLGIGNNLVEKVEAGLIKVPNSTGQVAEPKKKRRGGPSWTKNLDKDDDDDEARKKVESEIGGLNYHKRVKADYDARMAQLEYEKIAGSLVSAEQVKAEAFKSGRQVREAILNLPERLSAQLAAEADPHRCFMLLTEELTRALEALATDAG